MRYTVGIGWHPLVDEGIKRLEALGVNVTECYEKYGTLRFEVDHEPPEATDILEELEERSESICEFCGAAAAEVESDGWVKTLCPVCASKWKEKWRSLWKNP